jgi:hypothetical protein
MARVNANQLLAPGWDRAIYAEIVANSNKALAKELGGYLKSRGRPSNAMAPKLKRINVNVGQRAQEVMVQSYLARPRKRQVPSYRPGTRYSFGQLERALRSESNVSATSTTLGLLNISHMDEAAPQWYRMSFGVGKSKNYHIQPMKHPINGRILNTRNTNVGWGPRPTSTFSLPGNRKGRWFVLGNPGSWGAIFVSKKNGMPPRINLKMDATNFVQKGVSEINRLYPSYLMSTVVDYLKPGKSRDALATRLIANIVD